MAMNDDSLAVVRRAYDCYRKHDIAGLLQLIGRDCDWRSPGIETDMPWAGTYRGPEEVREFFHTLEQNLEPLEFTPGEYLARDDTVMVRGRERDRAKKTGKEFEVDWAHFFQVREGKIVRFQDYQDTAIIQAALH